MYVCVCNAVTDCQIRDAFCEGACSMRELRKRLGVAGCCGRCAQCARDLLNECRQQQDRAAAPIRVVETGELIPVAG
ncbi:(2Fe-2S)-binding protein [Endozoicomonas sp. G2_2]|uniref:(2Fe-2S)-binding protein n=1 Tax=Endozoicomonas sp. G2_2 TaxID=2821092 RepID=UPI001ADB0C98|nr:(2Fe-2S)-binding protein [Endozoicomonas sp. G2_2]MBO9471370.1 (2Fe-2S)-binding protein [Endozoicomonas sp. G2_2]|tara:strand:+ start:303 stop:533 length:231 start_codon:yes stop_codon:yes gene_type:complete